MKVLTDNNVADIGTSVFDKGLITRHAEILGMCPTRHKSVTIFSLVKVRSQSVWREFQ